MVFSFFRKGKGQDEPRTITPPRPVAPQGPATERGHAPSPAPEVAPATPAPAETGEADWDDLLLHSVATAESHSAVEEAAVLYANERVSEAIAALENFIKENAGSRDIQPWLLLFDLYQFQGMKAQFDDLSMEFVVRFERSAPVWEGGAPAAAAPAPKPRAAGSAPTVLLKGRLDETAEEAIQRLLKLAEGDTAVRLDVSQAEAIDASRAQLLAEVLMMIRKAGKRLALAGAREFTARVKAITADEGRQEAGFWRLLFELYEFQNLQAEFEDAAVDYAVTFEVSPPSWEPMAQPAVELSLEPLEQEAPQPAPEPTDVFALAGTLDASSQYRLKELERWAEGRTEVAVDLSALVRIDFMTVGAVISTLMNLSQAGKKVTLGGANEMVHALLEVMGARDFATLVRRKAR